MSMKLDRLYLPAPAHIGALNEIVQGINAVAKGCDIQYDPRSGVTSIFKGEKLSVLLPSGAIGDVSENQEEDDDAGSARSATGAASGRARQKKPAAPVQT